MVVQSSCRRLCNIYWTVKKVFEESARATAESFAGFADCLEAASKFSQTAPMWLRSLRERFEAAPKPSQTFRSRFEAFASASKSFRSVLKRFEGPGNLCRGCIRLYTKASERRLTRRGEGLIRRQRVRAELKKYMEKVQPIDPSRTLYE